MGLPIPFDEPPPRNTVQQLNDAQSLGQLPPPPHTNVDRSQPEVNLMRELLGFPMRSVRRHRLLSTVVLLGTLASVVFVALFMPRRYHVATRMTAQKTELLTALGNPRRSVPTEADSPTRLAAEAVRNRENLLQLVAQTKLVEGWDTIRSPIRRYIDRALATVLSRRPLTHAEKADAYVDVLLKSLTVDVGTGTEDGTVTIALDWFDAESAVRIVEQAQTNFLEQRRESEVGRIAETVSILQGRVDSTLAVVNALIKDSTLTAASRASARRVAPEYAAPRVVTSSALERQGIATAMDTKRQAIVALETTRQSRITDAQARLNTVRSAYGPAHPQVQALQEELAMASTDSPQLAALRVDLANLDRQLQSLGGPVSVAPSRADFAIPAPLAISTFDPALAYSESRLRVALVDYEDMVDRLNSAKIEMETASAAFKYRYAVSIPAKFPRSPDKPNLPLLAVGGMLAMFGLAVFAAMGADLLSGRLLEAWQVELLLGTPVLGHMERS